MVNKKKKIKITAIVLAGVLILLGGGLGVFFGFFYPVRLKSPVPYIEAVVGEPDYTVNVKWDAVKGAASYEIEYAYELFPGESKRITTQNNNVSFERMQGNLTIRIRPVAKKRGSRGYFSQEYNFDIPGITLGEPEGLHLVRQTDGATPYYAIDAGMWTRVGYVYKGQIKHIDFYEVAVVPPGTEEQYAFENTSIMANEEILSAKWFFNTAGEWKMYVRAINHKGDFGNFILPGEPKELFLFFCPGEWAEAAINVSA